MSPFPEPELNLRGGVAIERQIEAQIRDCIAVGQLRPGEELPTVRGMAVELTINPTIVSRAYASLERQGLLTSGEGSGTFVAGQAPRPGAAVPKRRALEQLCSRWLARANRLGFSAHEVIETIQMLIGGEVCHEETY